MLNFLKSIFSNTSKKLRKTLTSEEMQELGGIFLSINRWSVFLFLLICATMMIFYVGNVSETVTLSNEILKLQKENRILDNRLKVLNSEIIELRSAERICRIAEENLEMIKPDEAPILIGK